MNGKVGTFNDIETGDQLGGFFDWSFETRMDHALGEDTNYRGWNATARAWWGEKDIGHVDVRFYPDDGEFYWHDSAAIGLHIRYPGILMERSLDMAGLGVLEAVQLCKE